MNKMHFTFSDLLSGFVKSFNRDTDTFIVRTSDDREFEVKLTSTTYAEMVRNLNEPYVDCTGNLKDMLEKGRFLHAYGIFFPESGDMRFEAKHVVLFGRSEEEFRFEKPDWWASQIKSLADFYLKAEFKGGEIDYSKYTTTLNLEGEAIGSSQRQETDTISRLVYGFASAYLMTGDERYLEASEKGSKYLRDHMRNVDSNEDVTFWYHGIEVKNGKERKILASEFGDDYDAIPAYEQIYALAGPTQTFRINGDPEIAKDIEMTVNLMERHFLDRERGGYYSHIDPVTFDPRSETLGRNRCRKNWNSVGDHTPAYLINAYLATGSERYRKMLKYTADLVCRYFPDYENSSFVQEKFHEDWSHDKEWGWQQDRGVVGHNLKIAWNLMRLHSLDEDEGYEEFSKKIAEVMPKVGCDTQRGGWYDVMERKREDGQEFNRFVWHDRKAWWQQEQGILAYLILAGTVKDPKYLKTARESTAFYNAWFLDHDSGGIYFNVLSNGMPYLLGNERLKGSHSMSGYHSFELAYLAATYTNLLITKQPMDMYFKPYPHAFKDNILHVEPDILPRGSIKIEKVWIDDKEYNEFDAEALTVKLPETDKRVRVKVRITPASGHEHFDINVDETSDQTIVTLSGDCDSRVIANFRKTMMDAVLKAPRMLMLDLGGLNTITTEGARVIIFESQKMPLESEIAVRGANTQVKEILDRFEFSEKIKYV